MKTAARPLSNSTIGVTTDRSDDEHPHRVCADGRKSVVGEHGAQSQDWGVGKVGVGEEERRPFKRKQGQSGNTRPSIVLSCANISMPDGLPYCQPLANPSKGGSRRLSL